jgi:hypothetical protein
MIRKLIFGALVAVPKLLTRTRSSPTRRSAGRFPARSRPVVNSMSLSLSMTNRSQHRSRFSHPPRAGTQASDPATPLSGLGFLSRPPRSLGGCLTV